MKSWWQLGVVAAALVFSACSTEVEPPVARANWSVPAAWSSASGDSEGLLKIPFIADDPSLASLVEEALATNLDLRVATARLREAEAQARLAGAGRWPELSAEFSGSRAKSVTPNPFGADNPFGQPLPDLLENQSTRFELLGRVSWEVDLWGRIADQVAGAQAGFEASVAEWQGVRLSLSGRVVDLWLQTLEAHRLRVLAVASENNYAAQETVIERRFEAGLVDATDVRLARTGARSAAAQAAAYEQRLDALRRSLEVLVGRYPEGSLRLEGMLPPLALLPATGVPAELVSQRPDLRAAEARYAAAVHESGAHRKLRYPRLSLSATAGTASNELGDLLDSDFGIWSLAGGLSAPIFDAGRIGARIEAASAAETAALESFGSALLNAYREVETALAADALLATRQNRVAEWVADAVAAEERALRAYERGLVPILTVLEAQRQADESRRQAVLIEIERRRNRVSLALALGGGVFGAEAPSMEVLR